MVQYLNKIPKTILNKGTGYLNGYTHTLNPYTGCAFGCNYCYVRQMPVSLFRKREWGTWVDIKQQANDLLQKELVQAKKRGPVSIFMSSSTDPYQPIEYKEKITRGLLEIMVENTPDFLFLQTRSPLVTRDIDLLQEFKSHVRVSMTIETDREDVRKAFTPSAPPIQARINALEKLHKSGIPTQVAIAPILPSSENFPQMLKTLTPRIVIDDYYMGDGQKGARTKKLGLDYIYEELQAEDWFSPSAYQHVLDRFSSVFPYDSIYISQHGFEP